VGVATRERDAFYSNTGDNVKTDTEILSAIRLLETALHAAGNLGDKAQYARIALAVDALNWALSYDGVPGFSAARFAGFVSGIQAYHERGETPFDDDEEIDWYDKDDDDDEEIDWYDKFKPSSN